MAVAVEVHGLRKSYGGRPVVVDLDLCIEAGECFALLGPNGAGKTTTVEILEGFRRRDAGAVSVLGVDPAQGDRAWRDRIGVVGQAVGAPLDLTIREALDHFAAYHGMAESTDDLLAAVGLTEAARTRIPNLSGGQRRRLDVALGIQGRPDLLFLDEPTTGLDPAARRQFWTLLEGLRERGVTILLTTHYLDEAAHLADRVAVIAHGQLLETAPPDRLGASLRLLTTVRWSSDDGQHEIATATPTQTVRELLAAQHTGEVPDLTVHRPSLEEVYLAMLERAGQAR
jgi:ABC-2 type transport system ATP-binding protein